MDRQIKKQILTNVAPALAVPLLRAGANHHYTMKRMDKEKEMKVEVAQRRAEGAKQLAQATGADRPAPVSRAPAPGSPGDVYDSLAELRQDTDCEFCTSAIDSLMDAPPDEARQGYSELQSYVDEVDRLKDRDPPESEVQEVVGGLIDSWEVVPRHVAGMA